MEDDDDMMGAPGGSMNFSMATRAANVTPDMKLVRQYDLFQARYVWLSRIVYALALALVGLGVWLWQSEHGVWAALAVIVGLLTGVLGFMLGQGSGGDPYESGLLIPAIVIHSAPPTIAALADMRDGENVNGEQPIWGIAVLDTEKLPLHNLIVGERVPCIALFSGATDGVRGHLEPRPLAWATADKQVIDRAIKAIDEEEWQALATLLPTLASLPPNKVHYYEADFTFVGADRAALTMHKKD